MAQSSAISPSRIFLLSPARCDGKRAGLLLNQRATFALAERLRTPEGVTLGEAFSFMSGLYFRGKLAYATQFARAPAGIAGAQVITTNRGLVPVETPVGPRDLEQFGAVDIRVNEPRYRGPVERDLARLVAEPALQVVLLGSVATGKYIDLLLDALGDRLLFPAEFLGRGDMSRGALMLQAVREGRELEYEKVRQGGARWGRVRQGGES
jgi:hypothetical protein